MVSCQPKGKNPNNPNNPNNFSYEKVSVSYDVVRAAFRPSKLLITGNWQTHFRSWSSYGTGRTGRHFSYKTHLSSYKNLPLAPTFPSASLPARPISCSCVAQGHAQFPRIPPHCLRYLYRLMR